MSKTEGEGRQRGNKKQLWTFPVELSACIFMTYASFDGRCTCLCLQPSYIVCVCMCVRVFVLNQLSLPVGKLCPSSQSSKPDVAATWSYDSLMRTNNLLNSLSLCISLSLSLSISLE